MESTSASHPSTACDLSGLIVDDSAVNNELKNSDEEFKSSSTTKYASRGRVKIVLPPSTKQ